jgi:autotransporter adhesin
VSPGPIETAAGTAGSPPAAAAPPVSAAPDAETVASASASANAYTDATATKTLTSANAYTDSRVKALSDEFSGLRGELDHRLNRQDERINRQGAMSAAMLNMAINAANSRSPRGRVAVGAGWQDGESALSVGYSRPLGERASLSIGGAFSSDESSAGIGFGIDL